MTTIRAFFSKFWHFFPIFEKGQGRPPPLRSPLWLRACKTEIFCKRKKDFFRKKTFLQDTNYSCTAIFIIHTFISYILTHYSSALNRSSFPETLCYELNEVIDVIQCFLSKKIFLLLKSLCYALN